MEFVRTLRFYILQNIILIDQMLEIYQNALLGHRKRLQALWKKFIYG